MIVGLFDGANHVNCTININVICRTLTFNGKLKNITMKLGEKIEYRLPSYGD